MSSTNNGGGHSYGRGVSRKSIPTPSPSDTIMETHEYMRRYSSASQEKTESRYNRNRTNNTNDTNSSDELNPFPASRRRNAGRIRGALTNSLTKARNKFATPGIFLRRNTASSAGSIASHNTPINNNNSDVDYYSPIDSPNNNSPNNTNNTWDLDYCISIIESLQTASDNNVALTPLQVDAICHLRSASSASASKNNPIRTGVESGRTSSYRSRRNAHLLKDGDAALLTKELFKCFQEVEKEGSKDEQVRIFIMCVRSFGGGYVNF